MQVGEFINEEMPQEIFKSYFVDFDPFQVGAFEESELGMIPKGWRVGELGEFFPVITGKKNTNVSSANRRYPFLIAQKMWLGHRLGLRNQTSPSCPMNS